MKCLESTLFLKKTYESINLHFDNIFELENMAYFRENLILDNICEKDICIGDILTIGETKVQITQPRQPCWKLSENTNQHNMTKFIFQSGFSGFYAKVLEEGNISKKGEVFLEHRLNPILSIEKLNKIIVNPMIDESLTLEAC